MTFQSETPDLIRVAIVDDHQVLVDALSMVIANQPDLEVVGAADNCASCLRLVERTHPAVLLLDVNLPDGNSLDIVTAINRISPETGILILTSLTDDGTLLRAIDLGVSGFVDKGRRLTETLTSIREVACGEIAIPASLLLSLLGRKPRTAQPAAVIHPAALQAAGSLAQPAGIALADETSPKPDLMTEALTPRELEVLRSLARGLSGAEIASQLNISQLTVRTHVRNVIEKLGVHSRLEAVTTALRLGLIDSPV